MTKPSGPYYTLWEDEVYFVAKDILVAILSSGSTTCTVEEIYCLAQSFVDEGIKRKHIQPFSNE